MRACLAVLIALTLPGCDPDPTPRCQEAYDHLIGLAKRRPDPEQRARFVRTCREAFDEGRHRCLMDAATVEEALECRPTRIRPG
ncbi:MAG: hypothetical protein ACQEXJ_02970 [Myxococcota bacterium]